MVRRDAAAWSAASSVGSFVQQITRQLEAATELEQVKACIRAINESFIVRGALSRNEEQQPWIAELDRALELQASAVGWPLIQQCFYEDQFPAWATTVLTVAAGDWLSRDTSGDLACLISTTFTDSPAAQALRALVGHLSAVLPKHGGSSSSSWGSRTVAVTAVAADTAADILQQRFAAADNSGLQELLHSADYPDRHDQQQQQQGSDISIQLAESQLSSQQQQQDHQQQQQAPPATTAPQQQACITAHVLNASGPSTLGPLSTDQLEEVALQLASIPDRVQLLPEVPSALQPHPFIHHLLQQAVEYIAQASTVTAAPGVGSSSESDSCSSRSGAAAVPGAVRLSALLLQKFVTRGHAGAAAVAVLHLAGTAAAAAGRAAGQRSDSSAAVYEQQHLAALQSVLLQLSETHSAATEKLLVKMLRLASGQQQQQQQQQQEIQSVSEGQGGQQGQQQQQLLQALLCPLLLHSASLRNIATQQMLFQRTLPRPALDLLLLLLDSCQPSLIPAAAVNLAQVWSDKDSILHLPVPQQAYMTAALVGCIERLPRNLLDPATTPVDQSTDGLTNGLTSQTFGQILCQTSGQTSSYQGPGPQQLSTLLPSILHGVSSRLSSPSPAIRMQAMQVGRVFSVKLDPAKPLFEEAGDLVFMPEEIWPGALGLKQIAEPWQQQERQNAGGDITPSAAANRTSSSSSNSRFQALNRLHEALATPEPDSDDDDGHASTAAAAGGGGVGYRSNNKSNIITNGFSRSGDDDNNDVSSIASDDGSVSSLIAFDLQEDVSTECWWGPDGLGVPESGSLSLRGLAAAVRKTDDLDAVLNALAKVEVLVRAEPDELPAVAPELARSLLHCKIPAWTTNPDPQNTQTMPGSSGGSGAVNYQSPNPAGAIGLTPNAEIQRQRALVAVLSLSPLTVGDTLIAEVYSPHLDQYQRMLVLDTLAAAAAEMSDPRKAPRLAAAAAGQVPRLLPSVAEERRSAAAAAAITAGSGSSSSESKTAAAAGSRSKLPAAAAAAEGGIGRSQVNPVAPSAAAAAAPGMAAVSSRVWGRVSLQKQQQAAAAAANPAAAAAAAPRTFKNRFAPVAIRWTSMLLRECDVQHHGIDLFGRDSLLLGRLLAVLGGFVEAAAATPAAVPLAAGLLEVLRAKEVSEHKEVFVRRSALIAASQIVRHLPPARLAGAMIGRQQDMQDQALVHRLQWLINWCQDVASEDVDDQCRMLAAGCCAWHVELAEGALACIEHLPEGEGVSLVGSRGKGRGVGVRGGIEVSVPRMSERLVLQG